MNTCMFPSQVYLFRAKFTLGIILFLWESIKKLENIIFWKNSQDTWKSDDRTGKRRWSVYPTKIFIMIKNTESNNHMMRYMRSLNIGSVSCSSLWWKKYLPLSSQMNNPMFRMAINYLEGKKKRHHSKSHLSARHLLADV